MSHHTNYTRSPRKPGKPPKYAMPPSPISEPDSDATLADSSADENTLCAYGDISLSEAEAPPSLFAPDSPRKNMPSLRLKVRRPPMPRKQSTVGKAQARVVAEDDDPAALFAQHIGGNAGDLSPPSDFRSLFQAYKAVRDASPTPSSPRRSMIRPDLPAPSSPARQTRFTSTRNGPDDLFSPQPSTRGASANLNTAKSRRLPRRPALPDWSAATP
ncbi:hypothetical protein PLICRDRAFT_170178 [Plicaturopsis crispa FD-325 SS-3]|nr:hypothetical protein PLICRDRAFT_170178 [Plicaturopsis crispa FD-325 SS-3]